MNKPARAHMSTTLQNKPGVCATQEEGVTLAS